jgi:hypothetical protein
MKQTDEQTETTHWFYTEDTQQLRHVKPSALFLLAHMELHT